MSPKLISNNLIFNFTGIILFVDKDEVNIETISIRKMWIYSRKRDYCFIVHLEGKQKMYMCIMSVKSQEI